MRANSKDSTLEKREGSGSLGVINSIANGITKKSFFKGFLGRGGSSTNEGSGSRDKAMNKSLNITSNSAAQRSGSSYIGMGSNHIGGVSNM